jgi:hypothetical protein
LEIGLGGDSGIAAKRYPSDLTDEEWERIAPLMPETRTQVTRSKRRRARRAAMTPARRSSAASAIAVDTDGRLLMVNLTTADISDSAGANGKSYMGAAL